MFINCALLWRKENATIFHLVFKLSNNSYFDTRQNNRASLPSLAGKKKKHHIQLKVNYKHYTFIYLIFFLIQLQKQELPVFYFIFLIRGIKFYT